jgi:RecJ-like exonuclease
MPQSKLDLTQPDFFEAARALGERCLELKAPVIVSHYDADGLSAHGIVANALKMRGKPFKSVVLKRLDEKTLSSVVGEGGEFVFVDFGSGSIVGLLESLKAKTVLVIDHHPPSKESSIEQINPHLFGFDGSFDACAASTAYFCFRHLNNPVFAELGIVGAVGDMQDASGLTGLNKVLLDEAVEGKSVLRTRDLRIFGRVSRPLVWFLSYCSEPFLPGLTGNAKACALFLEENNVPFKDEDGEWLSYYDLNVFDRKKFVSALLNYCVGKRVSTDELVGDVYLFLGEQEGTELRDAYEYSTILNSCGRHGAPLVGVNVCLKQEGALEEAKKLLVEHRRAISKGIVFSKKSFCDLGAFYFLDCRGVVPDSVVGTVAGSFFNSGVVERSKPVLAFSLDEENNVKASARGSRALVEKGLDLGEAMKKAGEATQGLGGGHAIASGATFPLGAENVFLKKFAEVVKIQLQFP